MDFALQGGGKPKVNLVLRLLENKEPTRIVGLDNLNNYYDPSLKDYRLKVIGGKADEPFDSAQGPKKRELGSYLQDLLS